MDILFWILLFEYENWHFNFEICYLTSKNLFDLKIDIWILNYYFGVLDLYFNSKNYWFSFKGFFY
jgi:hypothetical protein